MAGAQKLVVEVVEATDLLPKDGQGTSSPYVVLHYYGQRRRTQTAIRDLNPKWGEVMKFNIGKPSEIFSDVLEVNLYHDKSFGPTRRNNFLGRISIGPSQFVKKGEEALIYYPLQKKDMFSWVRGHIGLKIYYAEEEVPPPTPPQPQSAPPPEAEAVALTPTPQEGEAKAPEAGPSPAPASVAEPPPGNPPLEGEALPPEAPEPSEGAEAAPPPEIVPPDEGESAPSEAPVLLPEDVGTESCEPAVSEAETEAAPQWSPPSPQQPEVMAAAASVSVPEVKFAGINAPPPLPRPPLSRTYTTDSLDSTVIERSSFDLVDKMHYLFVKVVKGRHLPTNGNPIVKIVISSHHLKSKRARKSSSSSFFEWDQTFAFGRDAPESSYILEVSVWDPPGGPVDPTPDVAGYKFFGGICFDVTEIPLRDPPDSPLAPQWYRLEGGGAHHGDLMLATWIGTQADEAFPDAWKTDTAGNVNARAKIYQSPKLWYLRAAVLEAQDIMPMAGLKESSFQVKAQLGFQVQKTKVSVTRDGTPSWNEDLIFVAAEPFSDNLTFTIENRQPRGPISLGMASIPLVAIERRVDDRKVASRWVTLENPHSEKRMYKGRVHLRLCFDGGYHVMDELAYVCSDFRPTARQLWKPPVGSIELGIVGCKNLLPMKMVNGRGTTDAYCVAKYGPKWVRTRTVCDTLEPKWNEQYTWRVYDPCTVLSIGVFDSGEAFEAESLKDPSRPDFRIGKVRVRISTLHTNKVYRNTYPLLMLTSSGMKKMGEVEIAIRFVRSSPTLDFLHVYSQPLLPPMHHVKPLGVVQTMLRTAAAKIVAAHLSRSEPPIRREVVLYMLDADSEGFSMRKVRANWFRIINVIVGFTDIVWWVDDTRRWKKPTATILVHALFVLLVWFPDLIIPTLAFYVFAIGAWKYRFRSRDPLPHFCPKISLAESVDREELDEEFDVIPSARPPDTVRARYDKLRLLGVRMQTMLGDLAAQGERVQALVTWRDPRATGIFIGLCFVVAMILYLVPTKMVAMASGFYYFRHPIFRDRMPSPALNFFRRLPSLADRMM